MRFLEVILRRLPLRGRPGLYADKAANRLQLRSRQPASADLDELREITNQRLRRFEPVRRPLVLISQVHRSGGTLLMRLFDGHPELHAVPHELGPLIPSRPVPLDADEAWALLYDPKLPGRFRRGLKQQGAELNADRSNVQFLLPPTVHRRVFERALAAFGEERSERTVVDAYLTGYFNAWLDYRGLEGEKRWVTGFEPALISSSRRFERFRAIYPDGRLIAVVREPAAWFASARRWSERFERLDLALALWRESALAIEHAVEAMPGDVLVLDFDELTGSTPETMASVAAFLDIELTDTLLTPTVNRVPFGANSSFDAGEPGVVQARSGRAELVDDDDRRKIEAAAGDLYRRLRALAIRA